MVGAPPATGSWSARSSTRHRMPVGVHDLLVEQREPGAAMAGPKVPASVRSLDLGAATSTVGTPVAGLSVIDA